MDQAYIINRFDGSKPTTVFLPFDRGLPAASGDPR
jgi:hypothetical protein